MTIEAFGVIPIQRGKTLLVKHQKGHWAFPKGHAEPGESAQETARRELLEETGLAVTKWLGPQFQECYSFDQTDKRVTYFLAEVAGDLSLQEEEIAESKWVTPRDAYSLATFDECKNLILRAFGASDPAEL
ncbi:MAG: NUDIX domain-containing protein [Chlamydiae bacterium]|nr:NUDIX domain-containing protein [Chlamydiota bacterium]